MGHPNKLLEYNKVGEISIRQFTTLSDSSMNKGLPHRIDGKFHPYFTFKPQIPHQYCMWLELMLEPLYGKVVPGTNRNLTSGGGLILHV